MKKIIFILILLLVLFLNSLSGVSTANEGNGKEENDSITTQPPQFKTPVEDNNGETSSPATLTSTSISSCVL